MAVLELTFRNVRESGRKIDPYRREYFDFQRSWDRKKQKDFPKTNPARRGRMAQTPQAGTGDSHGDFAVITVTAQLEQL